MIWLDMAQLHRTWHDRRYWQEPSIVTFCRITLVLIFVTSLKLGGVDHQSPYGANMWNTSEYCTVSFACSGSIWVILEKSPSLNHIDHRLSHRCFLVVVYNVEIWPVLVSVNCRRVLWVEIRVLGWCECGQLCHYLGSKPFVERMLIHSEFFSTFIWYAVRHFTVMSCVSVMWLMWSACSAHCISYERFLQWDVLTAVYIVFHHETVQQICLPSCK